MAHSCLPLLAAAMLPCIASAADSSLSLTRKQVSATDSTLDASYTAGEGRLNTTAVASLNPQDPGVVRLESAWTGDLGGSRTNLRLGDAVSNPGAWGNAVRFAGLQFGTPFAMRADVIAAPRTALPGTAILPSRIDSMFASPRVIASGGTVSFNTSLLSAPRAPSEGCKEYSMSVGRVRQDYALADNRYGPLFANTTVACGSSFGLAVEAHGEYLHGETGVADLNVTQRMGDLAAASVGVATSENEVGRGYSLRAGLSHSGDRIELGLRARVQSEGFHDLGSDAVSEVIAQRLLASVAAKLTARSKLGLAYAMQRTPSQDRVDIVALSQTLNFGSRGAISFVANHAVKDQSSSSLNLSFIRKSAY